MKVPQGERRTELVAYANTLIKQMKELEATVGTSNREALAMTLNHLIRQGTTDEYEWRFVYICYRRQYRR